MIEVFGGGRRPSIIAWVARRLPHCETVTRLISESFDRQLTTSELLRKILHQLICDGCTRFERQLVLLRQSLRLYATEVGARERTCCRAFSCAK